MADTIALIDFSNFAHAAYHPAVAAQEAGEKALVVHQAQCASCALGDACDNKPRQYKAEQVFLTNIDLKIGTLTEAISSPVKTWIWVKDGHDTKRKALFPDYKANRDKTKFDPRPMAEEYLRGQGYRFCWDATAEADDVVATMAYDLVAGGINVVIVSSDKDFWQLWKPPQVKIFLTTKNEWLSEEYMEKRLRVDNPAHVRLVKSVFGDPSDNVPSTAPRMQAQLVPLIKSSSGSLDDFLNRVQMASLTPRCRELLTVGLEQLKVNYELVGLRDDCVTEWL